jgi:hypothetical protein
MLWISIPWIVNNARNVILTLYHEGQAHRQAPQEALPVYSEQPVNNHQTLMAGQTNAAGEEDPPAYSSQ